MKNITKIIIGATILLMFLGIASATDATNIFQAPSQLQPMGTNSFVDQQGHNIMIIEYNDDNVQTWFKNDTNYLVDKYNETCYLGVDDENDCYLLETVEKDGTKYIISSWTPKGPEETTTIQDNLEEFNNINKLTPLPIEE